MTMIPAFCNLPNRIFYFTDRIGNGRGVVVIVLVYHAHDSGSIPCWGNILLVSFFPFVSLNFAFCNITRVHSVPSFITTILFIKTFEPKPVQWHVRPAKTQISLGFHPV